MLPFAISTPKQGYDRFIIVLLDPSAFSKSSRPCALLRQPFLRSSLLTLDLTEMESSLTIRHGNVQLRLENIDRGIIWQLQVLDAKKGSVRLPQRKYK